MNRVFLTGNLTREPELRKIPQVWRRCMQFWISLK